MARQGPVPALRTLPVARPGPVVFDAYGTLFDPIALSEPLERRFAGRGLDLAHRWRATQLRHTWLRSLMGAWADFDVVTREALAQTLAGEGLAPDDALAADLLAAYRSLPAYPDVAEALDALDALDTPRPRAVLTNGRRVTVEATIDAAGLARQLPLVLSVDEVRTYKPAPVVYALAAAHFRAAPADVTFISGNAWDCAGAASFGFRVVRIRRTAEQDEFVGPRPWATIGDLRDLAPLLRSVDRAAGEGPR